jgi:hypothetical protein
VASIGSVVQLGYRATLGLVVTMGYGQGAKAPTPPAPRPQPYGPALWETVTTRPYRDAIAERMLRGRREIGLVSSDPLPEIAAPVIVPPVAFDPIVVKRRIQEAIESQPIAASVAQNLRAVIPRKTAVDRNLERINAEDDALMEIILMELQDE